MTRPLYIFDLDGTLALIEHRRHFVEGKKKDWKAFYAACVDDSPNWPVIGTMLALGRVADIWIFSGRSDEVREETTLWLLDNADFLEMDAERTLTMRPAGDYTPDDKLKAKWLDEMLPADRERLVAVFEDRDRMVNMWRSKGIACFQVAPGDF